MADRILRMDQIKSLLDPKKLIVGIVMTVATILLYRFIQKKVTALPQI